MEDLFLVVYRDFVIIRNARHVANGFNVLQWMASRTIGRIIGVRTGDNLHPAFARVADGLLDSSEAWRRCAIAVCSRLVRIRAGPAGRRDRWLA